MSICTTNMQLRSAVLGAAILAHFHTSPRENKQYSHLSRKARRILIVDFRDEVYAALRADLERQGFAVDRATDGSAVSRAIIRFAPHLILMYAEMPGECAWLTTKKLRLSRCALPVWVYSSMRLHMLQRWQELSGANRAWGYGGDLLRLLQQVRAYLADEALLTPATPSRTVPVGFHFNPITFPPAGGRLELG